MSRMKYRFLVALIVLFTASSDALAQSDEISPGNESTNQPHVHGLSPGQNFGQPFLPLIDDVIDRSGYNADLESHESTVRTCQLNAPLPSAETSCACDGQNSSCILESPLTSWVVSSGTLQMTTTPKIIIQPEKCERCLTDCASCSAAACCPKTGESETPVASCSSTQKCCNQIADLLVITLEGSKTNPAAQRRAIETAFQMVAEQVESETKQRIDKLEVEQDRLFRQLSQQLAHTVSQSRLLSQNRTWLSPIYDNQNRTRQQLETIVSNTAELNRTVINLQRQVTAIKSNSRTEQSIRPDSAFARNQQAAFDKAHALEAEGLLRQLGVLEQRIKEFQSNPVQPARHLEPVYQPQRRLEPVIDTLNR